jgi:hypothetical protein
LGDQRADLGCHGGKRSMACDGNWCFDQAKVACSPARKGWALPAMWI